MSKPFNRAAENNKGPILEVLQRYLGGTRALLEIASGTGQHAVHFAEHLPRVAWQASELPDQHEAIRLWLDAAGLTNLAAPLALDVTRWPWPVVAADAVYCANLTHISGWSVSEALFAGVARVLRGGGLFFLYGPFNYGGRYTSDGNRSFDGWLKAQDPAWGVRDFEAIAALATAHELVPVEDCTMPANNRLLIWRQSA